MVNEEIENVENEEVEDVDEMSEEELQEKIDNMKSFALNGKNYNIKKYDFNSIVRLEELGFDLEKCYSMKSLRAILAYHTGMSAEKTGVAINEHIKKTGQKGLSNLYLVVATLEQSDFFKSLI
jgi:hypothetical protein